jgi:transforming growth factor-beta-induced protein
MKKLVLGLVFVLALSSLTVFAQTATCSDNKTTAKTTTEDFVKTSQPAAPDIVETAVSTGMFNTLITAVKAAGLMEILKGPGPLTVFAPTDEAFAKLPIGTIDELLKPENKEKLTQILMYHLVAGKVTAADVVKLRSAKTVQGQEIKIKAKDGQVMLDGSNVVKTDITTSNGVIHVIDTVLMPK